MRLSDIDKILNELSREWTWSFSGASGPGGQHVNRTKTQAELRWNFMESTFLTFDQKMKISTGLKSYLTKNEELLVCSQKFRSQEANKRDCVEKLKQVLYETLKPKKLRRATKPTRSSVEKRLKEKKKQSEKKQMRKGDY